MDRVETDMEKVDRVETGMEKVDRVETCMEKVSFFAIGMRKILTEDDVRFEQNSWSDCGHITTFSISELRLVSKKTCVLNYSQT